MPNQYLIWREAPQVPSYEATQIAQGVGEALARFLFPLLVERDTLLDKRLVRTFLATIQVIITFRDRANGLLLSELGSYLAAPGQAPAGTKRLSNLLHSCKWAAWLIARFLWQRARKPGAGVDADGTGRLSDMGRKRVGEAGESASRGAVCGAVEQSQTLDPLQERLLLPALQADLRPWSAVDRSLAGRSP